MLFRPPATYVPDSGGNLMEEFEGMATGRVERGSCGIQGERCGNLPMLLLYQIKSN